jgi:hypothetical protein
MLFVFCYVLLATVYWLSRAMMCKLNIFSGNEVCEVISDVLINPKYLFFIIFSLTALHIIFIPCCLSFFSYSVRFVFVNYRRHVFFSNNATEQNTWNGSLYSPLLQSDVVLRSQNVGNHGVKRHRKNYM